MVDTYRIYVLQGYAGWFKGQLDGEIRNGDWAMRDAKFEDIFDVDPPMDSKFIYF